MNPYVPLTCEEVLSIRTLSEFANPRVRVFGELKSSQNKEQHLKVLSSRGEESVSEISIDFR